MLAAWLLVEPPATVTDEGKLVVDRNAPLREWKKVTFARPSLTECEAAKAVHERPGIPLRCVPDQRDLER